MKEEITNEVVSCGTLSWGGISVLFIIVSARLVMIKLRVPSTLNIIRAWNSLTQQTFCFGSDILAGASKIPEMRVSVASDVLAGASKTPVMTVSVASDVLAGAGKTPVMTVSVASDVLARASKIPVMTVSVASA